MSDNKERLDNIAEVVNKHSTVIVKLNEKIIKLENKIKLFEKYIYEGKKFVSSNSSTKNEFDIFEFFNDLDKD